VWVSSEIFEGQRLMQVNLENPGLSRQGIFWDFSNVFKDLFIQCQAFKALLNG